MEDPAGCEAVITMSWGEIATAMYPVFMEGLGQIGGIISDPATIADVVTFLQVQILF